MNDPLVAVPVKIILACQHRKRTLAAFILLVAALTTNHFWHDTFMNSSIQVSIYFQRSHMDAFATIASTITLALAISAIPINAFLSDKKLAAFRMLLGLVLCAWIHAFLKLIYRDSRPSFLTRELRQDTHFCEKEFGMPSGHSMFTAYAFFCIANQYKKYYRAQRLLVKAMVYVLIVVCGATVVWSRLYFGVHSYNQVIIGVLLGTFIFTITNFSKAYLEYYVLQPVFRVRTTYIWPSMAVMMSLVMILMTLALYLAFEMAYDPNPEASEFYQRIVNCEWVKEEWHTGFAVKVFKDGLTFLFTSGIILGIALNPRKVLIEFSFNYDRNTVNVLLRLGCVFLLNLPMIILLLVNTTNLNVLILRPLFLYPLFGVITGRYSLDLIQCFGIPLAKEDQLGARYRDSDVVHI
jgi:membrane-associated phospholipid phosphatase